MGHSVYTYVTSSYTYVTSSYTYTDLEVDLDRDPEAEGDGRVGTLGSRGRDVFAPRGVVCAGLGTGLRHGV